MIKRLSLAALFLLLPLTAFAQTATCPAYSQTWRSFATTAYTVLPTDQCALIVSTGSSAAVLTLPVPLARYPAGFMFYMFTKGSGTVTLTASPGTTVNAGSTLAAASGVGKACFSNGTAWYCKP
jgi:hypothetical protein